MDVRSAGAGLRGCREDRSIGVGRLRAGRPMTPAVCKSIWHRTFDPHWCFSREPILKPLVLESGPSDRPRPLGSTLEKSNSSDCNAVKWEAEIYQGTSIWITQRGISVHTRCMNQVCSRTIYPTFAWGAEYKLILLAWPLDV